MQCLFKRVSHPSRNCLDETQSPRSPRGAFVEKGKKREAWVADEPKGIKYLVFGGPFPDPKLRRRVIQLSQVRPKRKGGERGKNP